MVNNTYTYNTILDFGELGEQNVVVSYYATKGYPGTYWEPPELPECSVEEVYWHGEDVKHLLSDHCIEMIEEEIVNQEADDDY